MNLDPQSLALREDMLFDQMQTKRDFSCETRFVCVPGSARYSAQRESYRLKHKRAVFVTTRFDVGDLL